MGAAVLPVIVESLILASAGLLSVGSITIVILLLMSERGWLSGLAYMTGYLSAYSVIGAAAVLVGYQTAESSSSAAEITSSVVLLLLAALLLWMAQRNWRRRRMPLEQRPRLFTLVDQMTPVKALALGAAVTVVNVKNLAIFLSAVSVVIVSGLAVSVKLLIAGLDAVVFSAAVVIPVLVYLSSPDRARERLGRIQQALQEHRRPIGIWVPVVFGTLFLVQGLRGLS